MSINEVPENDEQFYRKISIDLKKKNTHKISSDLFKLGLVFIFSTSKVVLLLPQKVLSKNKLDKNKQFNNIKQFSTNKQFQPAIYFQLRPLKFLQSMALVSPVLIALGNGNICPITIFTDTLHDIYRCIEIYWYFIINL